MSTKSAPAHELVRDTAAQLKDMVEFAKSVKTLTETLSLQYGETLKGIRYAECAQFASWAALDLTGALKSFESLANELTLARNTEAGI